MNTEKTPINTELDPAKSFDLANNDTYLIKENAEDCVQGKIV